MGLTWRDLVSSLAVVVIVFAYAIFRNGFPFPLLSSESATSAVVLALCAGCAVAAAGDLHTRRLPLSGVICRKVTTVLGAVALAAGLIAVLFGNEHSLEILVGTTIMVWATGTFYHVLSMEPQE
jgi:hypothetical protein